MVLGVLLLAACAPTADVVGALLADVQAVVVEHPVTRIRVPAHMMEFDEPTQARIDREDAMLESLYSVDSGPPAWTGVWQFPVPGAVTDPFGARRIINDQPVPPHTGLDLRGKTGTPVSAAADGRVVFVGELYIRGKVVVIDHGGGVFTTYAHLHRAEVTTGQAIARGTTLGFVGNTGRVTGPHLHWEVHIRGQPVDPARTVELTRRSVPR